MKAPAKFPRDLDPTAPGIFDTIIREAERLRKERAGQREAEREAMMLRHAIALKAIREKEEAENRKEAERERNEKLARWSVPLSAARARLGPRELRRENPSNIPLQT